jgi:Bacterial membrane protein YfhO
VSQKRKRKSERAAESAAIPARRPLWEQLLDRRGYVVPLFALLVLFFYLEPLAGESASIHWDAVDVHYSLQKYLADDLHAGHLPFWTPYVYSGMPFLADPQVGAWYPGNWPFFLAGITPRAIEWELALHAFLACLGMWLLGCDLLGSSPAAVLAAIFYAFSGFFAAHSSHVGMFQAAALFPWLLWSFRRAMAGRVLLYGPIAAAIGGLILLAGHFQNALYCFFALAVFTLGEMALRERGWLQRAPVLLVGVLAAAVALAAIMILPAAELTAHSIRAGADYSRHTNASLVPGALLTLFSPDHYGAVRGRYHGPPDITQFYFYAGLLAPVLAIVALAMRKWRWSVVAMLAASLWYAFGPPGGLYILVSQLPGFRSVRAPVHIWFVIALCLALLGGAGAQALVARWNARWLWLALVLVGFADLWYWNMDQNQLAYARSSFENLYGSRAESFDSGMAALRARPLSRLAAAGDSNAFGPMNNSLNAHVEATYGYNPLELASYAHFIAAAQTNSKLWNDLAVTNGIDMKSGRIMGNPDALPRVNVPPSLIRVADENAARAQLKTLNPVAAAVITTSAGIDRQSPGAQAWVAGYGGDWYRIRYHSAGPALLRIAVPYFPGWRARIDGRTIPAIRVDDALSGIVIPAGSGEFVFAYHPDWFAAGAAISLVMLIALASLVAWGWRSSKAESISPHAPAPAPVRATARHS